MSLFSARIPEGQAEAGSIAAGRLRSLEDQLTRAKQKIHSFQKLTGDGEHSTAGQGGAGQVGGRKKMFSKKGFGAELGNIRPVIWRTWNRSAAVSGVCLQRESESELALNLLQLSSRNGRDMREKNGQRGREPVS